MLTGSAAHIEHQIGQLGVVANEEILLGHHIISIICEAVGKVVLGIGAEEAVKSAHVEFVKPGRALLWEQPRRELLKGRLHCSTVLLLCQQAADQAHEQDQNAGAYDVSPN